MRPRHLIAACALLLCPASVLAFEGRILLPGDRPAADATVSVIGRPGAARTDREGRFAWAPDPPVPFQILVVLQGGRYMAPVIVESLPVDGPLIVRVSPLLEESVTVAAGSAPHIDAPPAAATNVVARTDIEQRQPARLADILQNIPGVGRLEEGHSVVPSVRGLARGRTLLLIDGARVTAERRAGPSATYLDPFFLEGVEVSRGPGSVAYGSDAFGGVIEARTRRPEPGEPLSLRFQASGGAGIPHYGGGVEVSRGFEEGGVILQARWREFGDYRAPGGDVFNSEASDRGVLLRGSHEIGPGRLTAGWQTDVGRDIGKPATNSRLTRAFYPREDSHRLTASYDFDPVAGFSRLGVNAFAGAYRLVLDRERLPGPGVTRRVSRADVEARDFGLRAFGARPLGAGRIEAGLDVNGRFDLEATGSVFRYDASGRLASRSREDSIEDARRTDLGLYATVTQPLGAAAAPAEGPTLRRPAFTFSGGLRADRVTSRNRGGFFGDRSTSHGTVSGFGSLTADVGRGVSVTGQLSRGFRDPTLSDRYFRGVSGRGFVTGNPDLDPETSLQADLAVRGTGRRFRWAFYAYEYRIRDLIERFRDPSAGEDMFFFRNRGRARLRGLEAEFQTVTAFGLGIEAGAHVVRGEARDDGSPLADIPARGVTLQLRQKAGERGYLTLRAAAYARDERPGPTEIVTPGYGVVDLGGGFRFRDKTELRVLLGNVLDKEYPATPDETAVAAPGRTALAVFAFGF